MAGVLNRCRSGGFWVVILGISLLRTCFSTPGWPHIRRNPHPHVSALLFPGITLASHTTQHRISSRRRRAITLITEQYLAIVHRIPPSYFPLFLPPSPQKKGIYKKPKSPYPTNKSSCKSSSTGATLPAQPSPPPTAQRDSTRVSHS